MDGRRISRLLRICIAVLGVVPSSAVAHGGTTHAATPHWILLVLAVGGGGMLFFTVRAYNRREVSARVAAPLALLGTVATGFGGIGLVELQVVGNSVPTLTGIYQPISIVLGFGTMVTSLILVRIKWPSRPRYAILGELLGAWILYPSVMPNQGQRHPLGYIIVFALPVLVAYIIKKDAWALVQSVRLQQGSRMIGLLAGAAFAVFFAFSAGTVTLNPDNGANLPIDSLFVIMPVADPLVVWPAIEFYTPSIPFGGYISGGTILLMVFLASLVGLNAAVLVQQLRVDGRQPSNRSVIGTLTTTGATACCCCAPAFYGVVSVLLGTAATPLYWAFLNPASPLGGIFFAVSVVFLLRNLVQSTGSNARVETVTDGSIMSS